MDKQKQNQDNEEIESEMLNECCSLYKQLLGAQELVIKIKCDSGSGGEQIEEKENRNDSEIKQRLLETIKSKVPHNSRQIERYCEQFLHSDPQLSQREYEIRQLISLNDSINKSQQAMKKRQSEYKQLMKKHYKFVGPNKAQESFNKWVRDKLLINIENVQNQMKEVYQIGGRSSISSSSVGNYGIQDWLHQEKEEKMMKEQEKLIEEIRILQEELSKL